MQCKIQNQINNTENWLRIQYIVPYFSLFFLSVQVIAAVMGPEQIEVPDIVFARSHFFEIV